MAELSDEQLLLLSNLMHMKEESEFENIWTEDNAADSCTIGELLESVTTDDFIAKLKKPLLDENGDEYIFDGEIESSEWAQMLESIRADEELCSLTLKAVERDDEDALSVCLADEEGKAYVVFRGTAAGEWKDNFIAAALSDTQQQRRALLFVERLPYDNVTVVGHSKGGNKAKYVTITSDKVERCVLFDGQGF